MNHTRLIQTAFGILFGIISISSFALSYLNLTAAAVQAGIIPQLAWLWPLCLDAFIIMGSLFILQANLREEASWPGWIVLLCFTVISTVFNIAHSPADPLSRAAHAIPPVALCASLELLMIRIKRDLLTDTDYLVNTDDLLPPAPPEKLEKVRNWFTDNPDSNISQARQSLRMGYSTVSDCKDYLVQTGQLSGLTDKS